MAELVVVGGGYAGMWAALAAARAVDAAGAAVRTTLVSRDPYLTLRPRLYERDPETLRVPLAPTLETAGVVFRQAEVQGIDAAARRVSLASPNGQGGSLRYDRLVLATGSALRWPQVPGLAAHGWNIDSWDGAMAFDRHLADAARDPDAPGANTFVIVGGGFCGVELACEMRDRIAVHAGEATAAAARVVLVEAADAVGPELGPGPRPAIQRALAEAGVELRLSSQVAGVGPDAAELADGTRIATRSVVVTTGLAASPLARALPADCDALGRLVVDAHLRVQGAPQVFAAGDIAHAMADDDHAALMSCQHAMPMGRFAGHNAAQDLLGLPLRPYSQPRYVTCLDLGRWGAVLTRGWDREVEQEGAAAKQRKRTINTEWIYPPQGDRAAILAAAAPPPPGAPARSLHDTARAAK